ncbi:MAG: ABC transporter glutamine-binding protein GlnH [Alphaproteobacteria bacterium MarineAlpha3_Bin5]|nr:murein transglycosylase [Magnetovibrio sp.]PPR77680.1 MAG: ABC transporter glutamine-binding protein GlnH [Alphaproteobacteria bacterium MarineAlpha3_Bin5]
MKSTRFLFLFVLGLMLVGGGVTSAEESTLDKVLKRGKVIVGVSSEAPPFGFIDDKGELVGFDIDIAKLIANKMFGEDGHIEFLKQGFAARWANANSGKIDFGIQITTVHSQRPTKVAFTRSYVDSGIVLVSKKGSGIKKIADANKSSMTVANLTVPAQEERAKRLFPKAKLTVFDSTAAQFNAVRTGRANAAQLDEPIARWYASQHDDVQVTEDWITPPTNNAVFTKLGDFTWWLVLDTYVNELRNGSLYPQYAEIYKKWFGTRPPHTKFWIEEQLKAKEAAN